MTVGIRILNSVCLITTAVSTLLAAGARAEPPASKPVDFNRDIRPIFASRCYACHGPDEGKRKAKLRLDVRESALRKAIKPNDAAASPLIERITTADPDERMPPAESKLPPLTKDQIELIRLWVNQGAKFDIHWAYTKPVRPALPKIQRVSWPKTPVDHFIAAGHEQQKLQPAPEADRITLARRLHFDLLGLPPSAEVVARFESDRDPHACEKLVESLLQSEHFGERMALYWLDLVRFADTAGYHSDNHRDITLYRDYVIRAFNCNKRFDEFTIEQIAGDLLPHPTREQRIASGYNRLLMTTEEGGAQAKEYIAKYSADRVRNASVVWLAGTMGCAECHNHKYDPFTTRDFYSFAAFFADIKEIPVGRQEQTPLPSPEDQLKIDRLDQQLAQLKRDLAAPPPAIARKQAEWEREARQRLEARARWQVVVPEKLHSTGKANLVIQPDGSVLSTGENPPRDIYTVTLRTDLKNITGIRLEALTHPSLTNNRLSRSNGNFVLTGFEVHWTRAGDSASNEVILSAAAADHSQKDFPVTNLLNRKPNVGWGGDGHARPGGRTAYFAFQNPIQGGQGTVLTVHLKHESIYSQHNIGRFRLALTADARPAEGALPYPAEVMAALRKAPEARTADDRKHLATHYQSISPELASLRKSIGDVERSRGELLKTMPTSLVSLSIEPRQMKVLPRGNWLDDSGQPVTPAFPAFLSTTGASDRRLTRLDLARWLVSRDNPLAARVFVNRLWKLVFGQGIVRSLEDFGTQGELPSHPQLLDWLAVEFMDSGWDVKHMLRLMVTSSAYRQSSRPSREVRERDPANRWLACQNRFRIDAEMIRDNALKISGLLVPIVGGASVKPYQPAGYWQYLNFPTREYYHDHGASQYRRGLYTYWQRTFPHPSLIAFDAPSREECTADRPRTSTPLQALVLLNDPTYVEAARVFATRIIKEGGQSVAARLNWAFRQALSRPMAPDESRVLGKVYERHLRDYQADKEAAGKLVRIGERPVPAGIDHAELAAWTGVARVILNLHETITRN